MSVEGGAEQTATDPPLPPILAPEVRDWFAQNFDQTIGRQRSQADTSKLLVTFALGVSATVVATALQVEDTQWGWCLTATIVLGVAFLLTILVILFDRVAEPDRLKAYDKATLVPKSPEQTVAVLNEMHTDTRRENETILWQIKLLAGFQLAVAAFAAIIAAYALLVAKA